MMKRIITLLAALALVCTCVMPAFAAQQKQRLYDYAGLLTQEEKIELESKIQEASDQMNMDLVILTTDDKGGKSMAAYADDFFDEGGFGVGDEQSGLLFLIDMEDRTVYLSTKGKAIEYFTDSRILDITDENDELYRDLSGGWYANAVEDCIESARWIYELGIPSYQYTTEETVPVKRLNLFEIILSLGLPALIAGIYTKNIKNQYEMKAEKRNLSAARFAYRSLCAFAFAKATDDLIDHHVTTRVIPRVSSSSGGSAGRSTVHQSSSGSFHGGGGGGRHF